MDNLGYPLRIRFADDEWASRVSDLARLMSDRSAFSEGSLESILCFLQLEILRLAPMHLTSRITFDRDATGWAGYTDNLSINDLGMGFDLALEAYELILIVQGTIELMNFKLPIDFTITCSNLPCIENRSIKMSRESNIESVKHPVRLGSFA